MRLPLLSAGSDANCECLRNDCAQSLHHPSYQDQASQKPMCKGIVHASMWHMYDSNTSQSPTASHRRGLVACGGDLKAWANLEQDAPNVLRCAAVSGPMRP